MVLPASWELLRSSVVSSKSVDSAFDKNKVKLGVLVLSVLLKVLTHGDGLLDKMVKILWDLWGHTLSLEDSENLGTSDVLHLRDSEGVSESDTDLRWGETLLCELDDMLSDILRLELQPRWRSSLVREG